jgi:DNA-binding NarL/FixJ family response regulator
MKLVRILIADDHDIVREGMKTLLAAHADFHVCGEATNGRDAVDMGVQFQRHGVGLGALDAAARPMASPWR